MLPLNTNMSAAKRPRELVAVAQAQEAAVRWVQPSEQLAADGSAPLLALLLSIVGRSRGLTHAAACPTHLWYECSASAS